MAAPALQPPQHGLTSLPSELVARAVSLLPSAEDVARADCVCRLFHVTPPPPAQPSACEWALRIAAAAAAAPSGSGRNNVPPGSGKSSGGGGARGPVGKPGGRRVTWACGGVEQQPAPPRVGSIWLCAPPCLTACSARPRRWLCGQGGARGGFQALGGMARACDQSAAPQTPGDGSQTPL